MRITIETPYGPIQSSVLDEATFIEIAEAITKHFAKAKSLTLPTDAGPVFIPDGVLRKCVFRFPMVSTSASKATAKRSKTRR